MPTLRQFAPFFGIALFSDEKTGKKFRRFQFFVSEVSDMPDTSRYFLFPFSLGKNKSFRSFALDFLLTMRYYEYEQNIGILKPAFL